MEPQALAVHPHCLTPPGTPVTIRHDPRTFTVLAGFVAYQDGKRRNCYVLRDEVGELHAALNGWLTPVGWLSERLAQLQGAAQEQADLREALRRVYGEI